MKRYSLWWILKARDYEKSGDPCEKVREKALRHSQGQKARIREKKKKYGERNSPKAFLYFM